jgi:putative FmdB family regulatory protein
MALYEYICKSCDAPKTISRGISEKEIIPQCDTCNVPLSRVYSSVGVTFNGGGFYSTDNKGR